jgi:hypothetical protein
VTSLAHVWTSLLSPVPAPIVVVLAVLAAVGTLTKVVPWGARGLGNAFRAGVAPALLCFTYPEFVVTSLCRRVGLRPLPGSYAYGRGLGALADGGTNAARWLSSRLEHLPRYPWKTATALFVAIVASWYVVPYLPAGGPKTAILGINSDVHWVDAWLVTGRWSPHSAPLDCPATSLS